MSGAWFTPWKIYHRNFRMERCLDVSQLEPPEPLERVLESLRGLEQGQYLHVLHRREPLLLYPLLEEMNFISETCRDPQGMYHIAVWHADDSAAQFEARQAITRCCGT